jgi:hypothetical protein
MTPEQLFRQAARIERRLRREGVPSRLIPEILGAAFMASLTNLSIPERALAITAHLEAMLQILADLQHAPRAPDGPMPDL